MHVTDTPNSASARPLVVLVFVATIFLSASLLFFVQPLFTKIVLPVIGGSPAVWTTAMLFFQTVLIAGYFYAHVLTRHLKARAQLVVHLGVWATALVFLPLAIPDYWSLDPAGPMAWQTLVLYGLAVGIPFFALAANAPNVWVSSVSVWGHWPAKRCLIRVGSTMRSTHWSWKLPAIPGSSASWTPAQEMTPYIWATRASP